MPGWRGRRHHVEQQPGAGIQPPRREDARVGGEFQVHAGQDYVHSSWPARSGRPAGEVLLAHLPTAGEGAGGRADAASAGLIYARVTHRSTMNVSTGTVPARSTITVPGLATFIRTSLVITNATIT